MDRASIRIASGAPNVHLRYKGERQKPTRRVLAGTNRFLAFPRVGCTASCTLSLSARPRLVGGDRGHSFAPLAVLPRRVLTALPLLLGAKSRIFSCCEPDSSRFLASAAQPVAHPRPALGLAMLED